MTAGRQVECPPAAALWARVVACTEKALRVGALQRIETKERRIRDRGVDFVVRVRANLVRKDRVGRGEPSQGGSPLPPADPFLPCDPHLFVADLSPSHRLLLNKFNVLDHHLLVVTRVFVDQESLLEPADFEALAPCMVAAGGLAFYNGGAAAGASQAHKHLQWVPLPLAGSGPPIPMEPLLAQAGYDGSVGRVANLPFRHAMVRLEAAAGKDAEPWANAVHRSYRTLLAAAGIGARSVEGEQRQSAPYNLLLTRDWLLLVPRSAERFEGTSVNALGFAGSLFVRTAAELERIRAAGPMQVLTRVAVASP